MTSIQPVTDVIAANLHIAAPIVAFVTSWVLYGILGKRLLGADDDYWPAIRRRVLPVLHRLGMESDLYAAAQQLDREFVGVVAMDPDALERELEAAGFQRNPLASLKTSPQGWASDGSWARRYGRVRGLGEFLRQLDVPIAGVLGGIVGRFLSATGEIFSRRQIHVTLYVRDDGEGTRVWLYGHDEPNSLNPLTAWRHYQARTWSAADGVERLRTVLDERGIDYETDPLR